MLIRDRGDGSHNHEFIVANVVQMYCTQKCMLGYIWNDLDSLI